jgi:bifunctional isochorismate lyase/aryl carrier protein
MAGLPSIAPYPMPTAAQLPANRVDWTPAPDRAVLLIHDMQNYFLGAFAADQEPLVELETNILMLRACATGLGMPVVYTAQPGGQTQRERGLQLDMWGAGIGADPDEAAVPASLAPREQDIQLTKWRYNAFHRTELCEVFDRTGRDQLVVCGIYAHIGCLMTAADAFMRDIQAFFVADAVADFSRADHEMAVRYAANRCAVTTTTERLVAALTGGGA